MAFNQKQIKDLVFATITEAKAAGRPNEVCYIEETKTFYDYVIAGSAYTANDLSILITGNGGDTRWRARAGSYIEDDVDFTGNYAVGLQNIPDLNANGQGYYFDGIDNIINIDANADIIPGFFDWSLIVSARNSGNVGVDNMIFDCGTAGRALISFHASGILNAYFSDDTNTVSVQGTTAVTADNKYHNIAVTMDRDSITGLKLFLGGIEETYGIQQDLTDVSNSINPTGIRRIGSNYSGSGAWFSGDMSRYLIFNLALTETEVKAFSSGAPIPYKYLGASQDEMVTDGDCSTDSFLVGAGWVYDGVNNEYDCTADTKNIYQDIGIEVGKVYRVSFEVKNYSIGTIGINVGGVVTGTIRSGDGVFTEEIFVSEAVTSLIYIDALTTFTGSVTNISCTQIGCVLQLEQPGIGHNQWLDNSGNELHGTADGALPTNLNTNHKEKVIKKTITGDTLWTDIIPAGYVLKYMIFKETAGNEAILDLGTSDGNNDIFTGATITASDITIIDIQKMFSTDTAQTLDLNDDQIGSSWNSASIDITLIMERIQL